MTSPLCHSGKEKSMYTVKKIQVARHCWRERKWIARTQRTFRAVKLFYVILQWQMCVIIHLSKLTECITSKVLSTQFFCETKISLKK